MFNISMKDNNVEAYDNWQYDSCLIINEEEEFAYTDVMKQAYISGYLEKNHITNKLTPEDLESS